MNALAASHSEGQLVVQEVQEGGKGSQAEAKGAAARLFLADHGHEGGRDRALGVTLHLVVDDTGHGITDRRWLEGSQGPHPSGR